MILFVTGVTLVGYCLWSWLCENPSPLCGVYRQPGCWFFLKKVLFYILFRVRRWRKESNDGQTGSRSGYGVRSQSSVESMEKTQALSGHPQALDAVYFAGFDKDGTSVVCRVGRRPDRRAEIWLFLEVPGVGCLQHPVHPDTLVCNTDGVSYTAGGLKIEMVEPMRTWQISYCGMLRKGLCNDINTQEGEFVHVKFSFLWQSFGDYFDFDVDIDPWCVSDAIAREIWSMDFWDRLKSKHQTHYEQWGEMRGRLTVEGSEERMVRLKCLRDHTYGVRDWRTFHRYIVHFIYLQTGMTIQCGIVSIPDTTSHLMVGYLSYPSGHTVSISKVLLDITEVGERTSPPDQYNFSIVADGKTFLIEVQGGISSVWYHHDDRGGKVVEKLCTFFVNRQKGYGVAEFFYRNLDGPVIISPEVSVPLVTDVDPDVLVTKQSALVLAFSEPACCSSTLVGGKGAQLAQLTTLQDKLGAVVPQGLCVTVSAYKQHLKCTNTVVDVIKKLTSGLSHLNSDALKSVCNEITEEFRKSELTANVREAIVGEMQRIWGDRLDNVRFAVRSSATGEDGSESSTAGQLDTYLGLIGSQQVLEGVIKCWASAYSYQAVQYRRQQGQELGVTVGVVIQEMVSADSAGVLFTKDPVSDNPSVMIINANYGLGESVVSGVSDPDTIRIARTWDGHMTIQSKVIGQKSSSMKMSESGGIESNTVDTHMRSDCCLSDDTILKLGEIGTELEKYYGSARDVEWAAKGEQLYMLQARPVTSQDLETEEDLIHEFDSGQSSDRAWLTTGNIGEMMPGAVTPLTNSVFGRYTCRALQRLMSDTGTARLVQYASKSLLSFCNHLFINLHHIGNSHQNMSISSKNMAHISILGETLPELTTASIKEYIRLEGRLSRLWNNVLLIQCQRKAMQKCEKLDKILAVDTPTVTGTAESLYAQICKRINDLYEAWFMSIVVSSKGGSWSLIVLSILNGGDDKEVLTEHFADLATLLSNCTDVISVDIPHLLQNMTTTIDQSGFKDLFVSMTTVEATRWLKSPESGLAGEKFTEFLKVHGHRCIREAEFIEKSWGRDPEKLTKILQAMLKASGPLKVMTEGLGVEEAIASIKTPVTWFGKKMLKIFVPLSRSAVGKREWGKSVAIKMSNILKELYWTLAEQMVTEGRLPEEELLFFLTQYEIGKLLRTRSPRLINKAVRRRRVLPKQMSLSFPKYSIGHAVPLQQSTEIEQMTTSLSLNGMPVSQGEITGTARIIRNVEDAGSIQLGDILIVPYTDVGWSPYFPLLGGLVTEIGGLVSHGAVVAREYGLPCVVNVPMATTVFKSGDWIHLDGSKGIIEKVEK